MVDIFSQLIIRLTFMNYINHQTFKISPHSAHFTNYNDNNFKEFVVKNITQLIVIHYFILEWILELLSLRIGKFYYASSII